MIDTNEVELIQRRFFAFIYHISIQAGIPKQKLVIALEPECAAVYCKSSPEMNRLNVDMNKAGLKYMVVDNGGLLN